MGLVAVVVLTALMLLVAVKLNLHIDPENAPTGSPDWAGPDAASLEDALVAWIREIRPDPPRRVDSLDELAAGHAFDMAMRNFDTPTTPEGEALAARRLRLSPAELGDAVQWQETADLQAGWSDPERVMSAIVGPGSRRGEALRDGASAREITEMGVGVAVERGRVALCVVWMTRWGTLDETAPPPAHDGWTFRGELAPGVRPEEIRVRHRLASGEWLQEATAEAEDVGHLGPDQAERFRVVVPVRPDAVDLEIQFLSGNVPGLVRRL